MATCLNELQHNRRAEPCTKKILRTAERHAETAGFFAGKLRSRASGWHWFMVIAGDFLQFVKSACKSAEISHTSPLAGPGHRCTARIGAESIRSGLAMATDLSLADLVGIVAVFVLILAVYLTGSE